MSTIGTPFCGKTGALCMSPQVCRDLQRCTDATRVPTPVAPVLVDDNPKTAVGAAKPPLHVIPPIALLHMGQAMRDGATKYGAFNWREKTISSSTYYDAAMRHLLAWWDGENVAPDSGVHHLAHAMACMALILDGDSVGNLNDNRPKAHGAAGAFIAGEKP